ncbi:maltokinase N-terminal cap-like domain-containing protein [Methylacidimicrobium cyclopophantes]|uniref:maltokinase N-terminal cap-like domain-containing protein n=1 Tax=Methylacidimicrobium cyclopophantes TaxID=1041766 RepID=UPI00115787C9|nr:phosphotransferase [Methylacidimicrobium cyclopophantes]
MPPDFDPLAERFWFSAEGLRRIGTLLPPFLLRRRWFAGKAHGLEEVQVADAFCLGPREAGLRLLLLRVRFATGETALFTLPLRLTRGAPPAAVEESDRIGPLSPSSPQILWEATGDPLFARALLELLAEERELLGPLGILRGRSAPFLAEFRASGVLPEETRLVGREQSNSALLFGNRLFFKLYRKVEGGPNPDVEVHERLSGLLGFPHVPRYAGRLDYDPQNGPSTLLGLLTAAVPHRSDAWTLALAEVDGLLRQAEKEPVTDYDPSGAAVPRPDWELLGKRTAEFHLAMASVPEDPAFRPEPLGEQETLLLSEEASVLLRRSFGIQNGSKEPPSGEEGQRLAVLFPRLESAFRRLSMVRPTLHKIRIHGDYHLGQVLVTDDDFVLIDFEGEPERPLAERRRKAIALRDVAGMVRSFHYAALAPIFLSVPANPHRMDRQKVADRWRHQATQSFLDGYYRTAGNAPFLPRGEEARRALLEFFLLEKAVYEVGYERNNRPAWIEIPLRGIEELLATGRKSEENRQP